MSGIEAVIERSRAKGGFRQKGYFEVLEVFAVCILRILGS